mmetsp:Transcript_90247/g.159809  ORF Transcript_90247/g.159809 Transcript_90247/m.159809 type:complete len:613 (+) Transcript_90247:53-1891(+)
MTSVASSTLPPVSARGQSLLARAAEELRMESRDGIRSDKARRSISSGPGLSLDLDSSRRFSTVGPHSARVVSRGRGPLARHRDMATSGQQHLTVAAANGRRKGVHSDVNRGKEEPEDRELRMVCEQIGLKAAQKFNTVREAFRYLDADHDGKISRGEIHYFFRAYNIPSHIADRFFDKLDRDGSGEVDYGEITKYLARYIQSDNDECGGCHSVMECDSEGSTRAPSPLDFADQHLGSDGKVKVLDEKMKETLSFIGMKSVQKFTHVRSVLRAVDVNDDGWISKKEMRDFYRVFNLAEKEADELFTLLGGGETSDVSYQDFVNLLGPFLELPGTQAAMLQRPAGSPPSNRPSRRSSLASSGAGSRPPEATDVTWYLGNDGASVSDASQRQSASKPAQEVDMEKELRDVMRDIGAKLPLRFRHVRDAFRPLDLNHNGKILRTEMRSFLRGFGWSHEVADRIFAALDEEGCGEIDFNMFMSHFDTVLGPANRLAIRRDLIPVEDAKLREEVNQLAGILGEKLLTKFSSAREALSSLDLSNDGKITQADMRRFFRTMCMPMQDADRMFKSLRKSDADFVDYNDFVSLFGQVGKAQPPWRAVQDLKGSPRPTIWKMM